MTEKGADVAVLRPLQIYVSNLRELLGSMGIDSRTALMSAPLDTA